MFKILLVSDSPTLNTGYAQTLRYIADSFLEAGHEVRQIAFGLHEPVNYKYHLYPTPKNDYFGKTIFPKVVDEFLPHVVISFHDLFNISWIANYPNRFFHWMAYFPIDSEWVTISQKFIAQKIDQPIVYSKTALDLVLSATKNENIKIIYHGLETDKFIPLDKQSIKQKYGLQNKFVVGSIGRNNPRKNFPSLIKAFAKFAEGKDDTVLYLHTALIDAGHNLGEYIKRYNIDNKIIITKDLNPATGVNENQLVEIYNLFDVFVSTTAGEGLGLPLLEAQSCGVPTMVTDYGACKEFVPENMRIKVKAHYFDAFTDCERAVVDEDDLVANLNRYYENRTVLPIIGEQRRRYIEGWDWKYIKPMWSYLIELYASNHGIQLDDGLMSKFIKV